MRKQLRVVLGAALVALTVVTLSGCGASSSASSNSKGPITWWVPEPGPTPNVMQDAAAAFTKESGIKVNVDTYPWSSYQAKLTTALTSGSGPDVATIGNTWAAGLAATNGLMSWNSAQFKTIGGESQFVKTTLGVTGAPGQPPASVPFMAQTWVLLYNKPMFAKAGISGPPTTWAQLVADAKKLTDPSKKVYGIATTGSGSTSATQTFGWVLASQYGGSLMTKGGKATLDSPQTVTALTNWLAWAGQDGIMSPDVATDSTGTLADAQFEQGLAAMDITQNPAPAVTKASTTGLAYIPLATAGATGTKGIMSHVAGENLAIFKGSKHVSEDEQFIKFLLSTPEQVKINASYYQIPVTTAAAKDPSFNTPAMKVFNDILANHAQPSPTSKNSYEILIAYGTAIVNLFRQAANAHNITPAEVSAALQKATATANATSGQ